MRKGVIDCILGTTVLPSFCIAPGWLPKFSNIILLISAGEITYSFVLDNIS